MKNALIIGGSTGMGFNAATRLAQRGVSLTIVGRSEEKLNNAATQLKQDGAPTVTTKSLDLYNANAVDQFISEIENVLSCN